MNLSYVESYLSDTLEFSNEYIKDKVRELILSIKDYRTRDDTYEYVDCMLRTVDVYDRKYLMLLEDYNALKEKDLQKKLRSAQEILNIASLIDTYMINILGRINANEVDNPKMFKIKTQLLIKKEHYKNEKFVWIPILKSLTEQLRHSTELKIIRSRESE